PVRRTRSAPGVGVRKPRSLEMAGRAPSQRAPRTKAGRRDRGAKPSATEPKREPTRTCVGCGAKSGADQLLRAVPFSDLDSHVEGARDDSSGIVRIGFDLVGKQSGRGAWVHARVSCLQRAC